jgi:hypothetical protein
MVIFSVVEVIIFRAAENSLSSVRREKDVGVTLN